jgi:hypothetical protein
MTSWEQALKNRLSALLPDDSPGWTKPLLEPFWTGVSHSSREEADGQPKVGFSLGTKPPFWTGVSHSNREEADGQLKVTSFDLRPDALPDESREELPGTRSTSCAEVKLQSFFLSKGWSHGSTGGAADVVEEPQVLPKPDDSTLHLRERQCTFRIQDRARFGMVLEETPEPLPCGLLVVTHMDAWSAFARTSAGACGLMVGDVITEVNGQKGSASSLREVLRRAFSTIGQKSIHVVARSRPLAFNIELWREGTHWQKLGIAAGADKANPGSLLVQGLHADGLAPAWNAAHGSLRICKGDLITHVNGISQDPAGMKKEIQHSAKGARLQFRFVTPAGQVAGLQDGFADRENSTWPETTAWDMQVRWLDDIVDDSMSEVSTAYTTSHLSGIRTPDESITSGTRTPDEYGAY